MKMKKKFEITGVNIGVDGCNHDFLKSFRCKDDSGNTIDIDALICDAFPELDCMAQDEQVDWAREMIGKTLFTEGLVACEYTACGKTYIV